MNSELLNEASVLWDRNEKATRFEAKMGIFPFREGERLIGSFQNLAEQIPDNPNPATLDAVYEVELKRRLVGEAVRLDHALSGHYYTFGDVLNLYGIDEADVNGLRGWLEQHREPTLEAIDRLHQETEIEGLTLPTPSDVPGVRRQAEEFCGTVIENYHRKLGGLFQRLTEAGGYLRDINSVPTSEGRSYFNQVTKTLALGIPAISFMSEDRSLHINERMLIQLFGHEGMGHGLNFVITENATDLPFFLRRDSAANTATVESVAQFYERRIFEDLAQSPKTQRELGISQSFDEIYKEAADSQTLEDYQLKLFQYLIVVLADKSLGNPNDPETIKTKIDRVSEVALYPGYAVGRVERFKHNYDSQGNLDRSLVGELRYCAQPVQRVLDTFASKGMAYDSEHRSKIDMAILRGLWTPIGLVQHAQVTANQVQSN